MKKREIQRVILLCSVLVLLLTGVGMRSARALQDTDNIDNMLSNIRSSVVLGREMREEGAVIAGTLLRSGFEPAYVAGVLANVAREGRFGVFENMNYSESVTSGYIRHMHGWSYDEGHWDTYYKYSTLPLITIYGEDRFGEPVSLQEVIALAETLHEENYTGALFGLGCLQWTYWSRLLGLLSCYQAYAASDNMTKEECVAAELAYMTQELTGSYRYIYNGWMIQNKDDLDSTAAAYDAASRVCLYYCIPANKTAAADQRGIMAMAIYSDMIKPGEQEGDAEEETESDPVRKALKEAGYEGNNIFYLPAAIVTIGEEAFWGTDAEVIVLPEKCKLVEVHAFSASPSLKYVVLMPGALVTIVPDESENVSWKWLFLQ